MTVDTKDEEEKTARDVAADSGWDDVLDMFDSRQQKQYGY